MFARAIAKTEQMDIIEAAETALGALLRGATALRYLRMHPDFVDDAVQDLLRTTSVRRKGKRKQ